VTRTVDAQAWRVCRVPMLCCMTISYPKNSARSSTRSGGDQCRKRCGAKGISQIEINELMGPGREGKL